MAQRSRRKSSGDGDRDGVKPQGDLRGQLRTENVPPHQPSHRDHGSAYSKPTETGPVAPAHQGHILSSGWSGGGGRMGPLGTQSRPPRTLCWQGHPPACCGAPRRKDSPACVFQPAPRVGNLLASNCLHLAAGPASE